MELWLLSWLSRPKHGPFQQFPFLYGYAVNFVPLSLYWEIVYLTVFLRIVRPSSQVSSPGILSPSRSVTPRELTRQVVSRACRVDPAVVRTDDPFHRTLR